MQYTKFWQYMCMKIICKTPTKRIICNSRLFYHKTAATRLILCCKHSFITIRCYAIDTVKTKIWYFPFRNSRFVFSELHQIKDFYLHWRTMCLPPAWPHMGSHLCAVHSSCRRRLAKKTEHKYEMSAWNICIYFYCVG